MAIALAWSPPVDASGGVVVPCLFLAAEASGKRIGCARPPCAASPDRLTEEIAPLSGVTQSAYMSSAGNRPEATGSADRPPGGGQNILGA